jgi:23S rRNA (cytidine1920-2'-O)/16S rRNA (cytidine1409-2'-O)-methyltransferase
VSEVSHRLDVELVTRGLARSRGQARDLVKAGSVLLDGSVAKKASTPVHAAQMLELAGGVERWVSRAAYKLVRPWRRSAPMDSALPASDVSTSGQPPEGSARCCCNTAPARSSLWTSVMASWPKNWPSTPVSSNARATTFAMPARATWEGLPSSWWRTSVSSLCGSCCPFCGKLVEPTGDLVVLVKPQFEVGRERLGKGGIVRSAVNRARVIEEVVAAALACALTPKALCLSPIRGAPETRSTYCG